ncbi:MAG: class I SAM-dependent methyltransferase [Rhodospirillaceae bacterium]|nr:class I SAM-dependent methyltransferase [Rhodospirillaceae bacterium]
MREQARHPISPTALHDEDSRQTFAYHIANYIRSDITPRNKTVYEREVRPAFESAHGRPPRTRQEVRKAMEPSPAYKMSSALQRCSQEMMWAAVAETVGRDLPRLVDNFRDIAKAPKLGSLRLDPDLPIPNYAAECHHHCMAGGYHAEHAADDVFQGALYDRGSFIYVDGNFGPWNDGLGVALAKFARVRFPDFKPKRILDIGCTVGGSSVALAQQFPEAEVFAVDVGAPVLRYAHARAEHMGVRVHFSQQNGEHTDFTDGSFDLVCSAAMLHETAHRATLNILKESRRLVRPGGMMVHSEIQPYRKEDPWIDFTRDWDSLNNNEPFWGTVLDMDLAAEARKQGWAGNEVWSEIGYGPAEAHNIKPEVDADKVMGASRGARGLSYLCGIAAA